MKYAAGKPPITPSAVKLTIPYLSTLGVQVDEVLQAPLGSINVSGTPTLMLISRDGTVIRTWLGKLPIDLEKEVLLSVGAEEEG